MSNPTEVLQKKFSESVSVLRQIDPGKLDADDFVINDIPLKIPPEQIHVEKKAFNHEYQTLRTRQSQKVKSGYGVARVTFSTIFKVSDPQQNEDMSCVVAGLRATPFCVVYNKHLERVLGLPDQTSASNGQKETPFAFRPIMLALASMTFETMGHEGSPDCVRGSFDFIWFNYFPYTDKVAFKSGALLNEPGFPWQSPVWRSFYAPFKLEQQNLFWPHGDYESDNRKTLFSWREFMMVPNGSAAAFRSAVALGEALQKRTNEVIGALKDIVIQGASGDRPNTALLTNGALGTLTHKLIKQGVIKPNDELRKDLSTLSSGAIDQAAGSYLNPIISKLYSGGVFDRLNPSQAQKDELDIVVKLLKKQAQQLDNVQARGDKLISGLDNTGHEQLLSIDAKFGAGQDEVTTGAFSLFGRKRFYAVKHLPSPDQATAPDAIIQRIVVSFENILATIPMSNYRYPTVQHIGSVDARVSMTINARPNATKDINTMYDSIETMALRFKQVPAGFTNLYIENDFLKAFALSEFITERISTSSIPNQPSRNMIELSLTEAGVTSKTKLVDPEEIKQEYISTSSNIKEAVWNAVLKVVRQKTSIKAGSFSKSQVEFYELERLGVATDGSQAALKSIVDEAVSLYNTFLRKVHKQIFDSMYQGDSALSYGAIKELQTVDPAWGFIPNLGSIQKSIIDRNKAYREAGQIKKTRSASAISDKALKEQAKARLAARRVSGNAAFTAEKQIDIFNKKRLMLGEMGLISYLRGINALFDKVQNKFKYLPEFAHLSKIEEREGLRRGTMAYPDFRKQLAGVAKWTTGGNPLTGIQDVQGKEGELIKYEPDCYFWYPLHDGGNGSSLLSTLVDPTLLLRAQQHSLQLWNKAQGSTDDFFQNTYRTSLLNPNHMGPYDVLTSDFKGTKLVEPFYNQSEEISNSTVNEPSPIHKSVVVDPKTKVPTNWYSENNPLIRSNHICSHTTDMNKLWGGLTSDTNYTPNHTSDYRNSTEGDPTANPTQNTDETGKPSLSWPIKDPPVRISKGERFGAPRGYRGGTHGGIDMPEPSRAKGRGPGDGIYGSIVLAAGNGKVTSVKNLGRVGGLFIQILHPGGWKSEYMHLKENSIRVKVGDRVSTGTPIAQIGRTGNKHSPTHLHFQVRNRSYKVVDPLKVLPSLPDLAKNVQRRKPAEKAQRRLDALNTQRTPTNVTATAASPLKYAIEEFEKESLQGQGQSLLRAYPTFKLYFIEDDSGERTRLAFDDFFSYNSVQSIRVVRSRKIAADLCELYLTNISGVLSNRKFRNSRKPGEPRTKDGQIAKENISRSKAGTKDENPIASLLLQEGISIHLRMGYSNDPDRLPTVFNGVITEVQFSDSDDIVRVLAQSHAIELVQDIKGLEKPETKSAFGAFGWTFWGFNQDATTGRILEEMLAEPEVLHFGRWDPVSETGDTFNRTLLTQRWKFQPSPADDNVFAPSPTQDLNTLGNGTFFQDLQYIIYRTTIWDICQEMTLRHPNYIASPVPYAGNNEHRMTMFFGLPNQLYFAEHPTPEEQNKDLKLRAIHEKLSNEWAQMHTGYQFQNKGLHGDILRGMTNAASFATGRVLASKDIQNASTQVLARLVNGANPNYKIIQNILTRYYRDKRLDEAKKAGYLKPFRNYHLITGSQHLIANNIRANSRDVANTICIKYAEEVEISEADGGKIDGVSINGNEEEFTLKLDSALPTDEIRTQMGQFINVTNQELAKRYALGLLCRNLKEIYKGEIITIGNPKIKPYDVCYLFDDYTEMTGAFEVEEVQHIFDQRSGFRTEIKPDMLVQAAEWSLMGSNEALGIVMEGVIHKYSGVSRNFSRFFAPAAYIMGQGINLFGGFLGQKILNYTQLAQPVIMSPMIHKGRIFSGGVPTRKIPTSIWSTAFGKWDSAIDAGYYSWREDLAEEINGWTKGLVGKFASGNFFSNGGDYPI